MYKLILFVVVMNYNGEPVSTSTVDIFPDNTINYLDYCDELGKAARDNLHYPDINNATIGWTCVPVDLDPNKLKSSAITPK